MPLGPILPLSGLANALPVWSNAIPDGTEEPFTADVITIDGSATPAKFMILHLRVPGSIPSGATVRVDLKNGEEDRFDSGNGEQFWTRPIAGDATTIRAVGANINVEVIEYGHGHVDIFLMGGAAITVPCAPRVDGYHETGGSDTSPAWEHVRVLPAMSTLRQVARSVGLIVYARPSSSSGCDAIYNNVAHDGTSLNVSDVIGNATAGMFMERWIITAAHVIDNCIDDCTDEDAQTFLEIASGSFTVEYELPPGEDTPSLAEADRPKFYKLKQMERTGFRFSADGSRNSGLPNIDYAIVEIDVPAHLPTPPTLLTDTGDLTPGEQIFMIHHPGGLPKQVSRRRTAPTEPAQDCQVYFPPVGDPLLHVDFVIFDCDCDSGSSGAPVFNSAGKIVGITKSIRLSEPVDEYPGYEHNWGYRTRRIVDDFEHTDRQQVLRIAVVVDTSGSMGIPNPGGLTKMRELQLAVEQFMGLLRATAVAADQHYVGLVSFSSTAAPVHEPADPTILPFDESARSKFIGPPPHSFEDNIVDGLVGGLSAGGLTSIGAGLEEGQNQIGLAPSEKIEAILLMTDGMHNTGTAIEDAEALLGSTGMRVIGFGSEGNLDGERLFRLSNDHAGEYIRAQDGLDLMKFFAVEYGRIFEQGELHDPVTIIPAGQDSIEPINIHIFYERSVTVVVGWDHLDTRLELSLRTPSGQPVNASTQGVRAGRGATWMFLQIDLPLNGEYHGPWQILADRQGGEAIRFRGHDAAVLRTTFSPDGTRALSASVGGDIRLWDIGQARAIRQYLMEDLEQERGRFIIALDFHPTGEIALSGSRDGILVLWDVAAGREVRRLNIDNRREAMLNALFSPDGATIASVHRPGGIRIWDVDTGELVSDFEEPLATDLAFDPTGEILAVLVSRGSNTPPFLRMLNLSTGDVESIEIEDPTKLAYSPTGDTVLIGLSSGSLSLYSVENGIKLIGTLDGHDDNVFDIAYSPDGRQALSCSGPGVNPAIILWDLQTRTRLRSFIGHDEEAQVYALDFHPEGALALSGSADRTLILWNVVDGKPAYGPLDLDERFFVTSLIKSTVFMRPANNMSSNRTYTGDNLYPKVILRHVSGARIPAEVTLEITTPTESTGNILAETGMREARSYYNDQFDARFATLTELENQLEDRLVNPLIPTQRQQFTLFDDGLHADGAMEPDGVFGNIIPDVTRHEGNYRLRAIANFGPNLEFRREATWSVFVASGVDPDRTEVTTAAIPGQPDGSVTVTITPKDKYGNFLGPGRVDSFSVEPAPGNDLLGDLRDTGQGQYEQDVKWDQSSGTAPGIIVVQPNRSPMTFPIPEKDQDGRSLNWLWILLILAFILIVVLVIILLKFS